MANKVSALLMFFIARNALIGLIAIQKKTLQKYNKKRYGEQQVCSPHRSIKKILWFCRVLKINKKMEPTRWKIVVTLIKLTRRDLPI
jgi:hypothetical protein